MLIVIEGITNSGKTTLCNRILSYLRLQNYNIDTYNNDNIVHRNIKEITHDKRNEGQFTSTTELLLYSSLLSEKAHQILNSPGDFIIDRFSLSVFSYFVSKYCMNDQIVHDLIMLSTSSIIPDYIVYIDVPLSVILSRTKESPLSRKDLGLSLYYNELRHASISNISRYSKNHLIVDGTSDVDSIAKYVLKEIGFMS